MRLPHPATRTRFGTLFALGVLLTACTAQRTPTPMTAAPPAPAVPSPAISAATRYEGSLSYPARIALPPGTEALIEVLDSRSERRVAASRFALEGRQVPIPFAIDVPATSAALVLQASFVVNGRKRWRSQMLPVSASKPLVGTLSLGPIAPSVIHYRCGETLIGFSPGEDDRADLILPSRRIVLNAERTASGAKYVATDETGTWFWDKAGDARVAVDGVLLPACVRVGD